MTPRKNWMLKLQLHHKRVVSVLGNTCVIARNSKPSRVTGHFNSYFTQGIQRT